MPNNADPRAAKKPRRSRAAEVTIFSNSGGGKLTKSIKLAADGTLAVTPAAAMARGTAGRVRIKNIGGLATVINRLGCNEALTLGRLRDDLPDRVKVVTKAKLNGSAGTI